MNTVYGNHSVSTQNLGFQSIGCYTGKWGLPVQNPKVNLRKEIDAFFHIWSENNRVTFLLSLGVTYLHSMLEVELLGQLMRDNMF